MYKAANSNIFTAIFQSGSNEHLSELYEDLNCQHYLVQKKDRGRAIMPALTPVGFAQWLTVWIEAYPEEEAIRLQKVVCDLPIDADGNTVDGKPERLPKVTYKRLL